VASAIRSAFAFRPYSRIARGVSDHHLAHDLDPCLAKSRLLLAEVFPGTALVALDHLGNALRSAAGCDVIGNVRDVEQRHPGPDALGELGDERQDGLGERRAVEADEDVLRRHHDLRRSAVRKIGTAGRRHRCA